ncbi:MAG: hypothetical protein JRH11_05710 [Deltaproteobacteria bacterium]|nr:hypothetical protein [Deltaproteobacteria bacterium]
MLVVSTASAQESVQGAATGDVDPRIQARALFAEGVAEMAEEDWPLAASKFEEALLLHSAPSIEYNLASAYLELGRIGEAGDLAASVAANPAADEELQGHARDLEARIAERAGTLTIEVSGDENVGATVSVDDYTVPQERVGVVRYESPGDHQVVIHRGDGSTEERSVSVTQGAPERVTFGAPLLQGGPGAADDGSVYSSPLFWGLVGAGVAVMLVAIIAAAATAGPNSVGGDYEPAVLRF